MVAGDDVTELVAGQVDHFIESLCHLLKQYLVYDLITLPLEVYRQVRSGLVPASILLI